jgi:succinate dehydrogenase / fumarate reductase membrane anchor subunit
MATTGKKSLRSDLGRVRGLGSAKDGTHHWWAQRVTAVALVPLVLWFVASAIGLAGAPHAAASRWMAQPLNAVLLAALVVAVFHHALHEKIRHPVGGIHVVRTATVIAGVFAQLDELFDVHVPGFKIGAHGSLALAAQRPAPFIEGVGDEDAATALEGVAEAGFLRQRFRPRIDDQRIVLRVLHEARQEAPAHQHEMPLLALAAGLALLRNFLSTL